MSDQQEQQQSNDQQPDDQSNDNQEGDDQGQQSPKPINKKLIFGTLGGLAVIGIVILVIVLVSKKKSSSSSTTSSTSTTSTPTSTPSGSTSDLPEVYLYYNPSLLNSSSTDATVQCTQYNAQLATYIQLQDAQTDGAQWCSGGYVTDGNSYYPMQVATSGCGSKVGIVSYGNGGTVAGATCYGIKPPSGSANIALWSSNTGKWSKWQ